ncbi:hypothetical protein [Chlamydiifrater volucris]|uniref:hypothetical protein n=1 Tax=Chlamydiifrater volucris TaxID=2681470 RepID=UPI001BCAA60C|nr:hypothetical protein [Chlamydiifrater volucris]
MLYRPLRPWILRKVSPVLGLFGIFASGSLQAMSAGNPADPILPYTANPPSCQQIRLCPDINPFALIGGNFRFGFAGDYIFSESAAVKNVPVVTSVSTASPTAGGPSTSTKITSTTKNVTYDAVNCSVSSSSLFATVAFQDYSPAQFPLLDVSFTAKLGGLATYYRLPLNAYRDFTKTPLASESQVTNGLVEVKSNYGIAWDFGIKKVIWKDGVSLISVGADYRRCSCPVDYVIVHDQANPEIYFDNSAGGDVRYSEWAFNIGLTTYFNDCLIPYIAVSTGNTIWEAPEISFTSLERQFTNLFFKTRNLKNYHRINICGGITYLIADKTYCNVEARWGYQRACNLSGGIFF